MYCLTVNLTTSLTPNAITVNNDSAPGDTYTFTGSGKLSGATSLTKITVPVGDARIVLQ